MSVEPGASSPRLAFSAAGFIATKTFGMSPGVTMSWSEMGTWNDDTPAIVPAGAADLRWVVRHRREVVAEEGAHVGEPVTRELHAVTRVACEADHDAIQALLLQ